MPVNISVSALLAYMVNILRLQAVQWCQFDYVTTNVAHLCYTTS